MLFNTFTVLKAYEVDLAVEHLAHTQAGDLLIMDRNYPSYRMMAELTQHQRDFVIRCSAASFKEAQLMLKGEGDDSSAMFHVSYAPCTLVRYLQPKQRL